MNILLFAKRNKPGLDEIKAYLAIYFNKLVVFIGEQGDKFPSESFFYKPDILISYMSPWIIPPELLNQTKSWNINFHPGPPNYPGIGCTNFAIYNNEKEYGVTAHIMEEKVDTGKIIKVRRFSISKNDTVYSLTDTSYRQLLILFHKVFDHVIKHKTLPSCNEVWAKKPYIRRELEDLCVITPDMSKKEIGRRVKSTEFPGMPGAYIMLYGYKFEYNEDR